MFGCGVYNAIKDYKWVYSKLKIWVFCKKRSICEIGYFDELDRVVFGRGRGQGGVGRKTYWDSITTQKL